jgi:hypothetical protein
VFECIVKKPKVDWEKWFATLGEYFLEQIEIDYFKGELNFKGSIVKFEIKHSLALFPSCLWLLFCDVHGIYLIRMGVCEAVKDRAVLFHKISDSSPTKRVMKCPLKIGCIQSVQKPIEFCVLLEEKEWILFNQQLR